jgi:hypothetical protein
MKKIVNNYGIIIELGANIHFTAILPNNIHDPLGNYHFTDKSKQRDSPEYHTYFDNINTGMTDVTNKHHEYYILLNKILKYINLNYEGSDELTAKILTDRLFKDF